MMTEEQKQNLAAECRRTIADAEKPSAGYRTVARGEIARIALAALTQPAVPDLNLPWHEKQCGECGSKSLSWGCAVINKSTVQNGLLRISDVDSLFYLGCDECSETVARVSPDEVVELLNALQESINDPHTAQIEPICATGGAEWVKVSERMPKDETVVLVRDERDIIWCAEVDHGQFYPDEFHRIEGSREITHWMELPKPPAVVTENG